MSCSLSATPCPQTGKTKTKIIPSHTMLSLRRHVLVRFTAIGSGSFSHTSHHLLHSRLPSAPIFVSNRTVYPAPISNATPVPVHPFHSTIGSSSGLATQHQQEPAASAAASEEDPEESPSIQISDSCVKRVKRVNSNTGKEQFLRVIVEGGGCSGFRYNFEFTTDIDEEEDIVFEKDGISVVVDNMSLEFVRGAVINYHEDVFKATFTLDNPNADAGCSCGSSFNIK